MSAPLREGGWREDATLRELFATRPEHEIRLELHYAVADALLAADYDAPVLCSDGRRGVVQRLIALGIVPVDKRVASRFDSEKSLVDLVDAYTAISGLTFGVSSYRRFADLKDTPDLRQYGHAFQRALAKPSVKTADDLYETIAVAMSSKQLAHRIRGAFEATGHILDVAGLSLSLAPPLASRA